MKKEKIVHILKSKNKYNLKREDEKVMKQGKKRSWLKQIAAILLAICMFTGIVPSGFELVEPLQVEATAGGVKDNGLAGIWIDVYKDPYTTFKNNDPKYGPNAYGPSGCAWFASARVKQLTGKGNIIRASSNWLNNAASFGWETGDANAELRAPAILCFGEVAGWGSHVAILEKIEGNTAYISEGGYYGAPNDNYCAIRSMSLSEVKTSAKIQGGHKPFIGIVYLPGAQGSGSVNNQKPAVSATSDTNSIPTSISGVNANPRQDVQKAQTETNWGCYATIGNPSGGWIGEYGVDLYDANTKVIGHIQDVYNGGSGSTKTRGYIWFDFNKEGGITLKPGTQYKYRVYVSVGGVKYYSDYISFKTKGSATPATPTISISKLDVGINEAIQVNWQKYTNATKFKVVIEGKNGTSYYRTIDVNNGNATYSSFLLGQPGLYSVKVIAYNGNVASKEGYILNLIEVHKDATVTFYQDDNGKELVLKTQKVHFGSSATPPGAPTKEGHTFQGWIGNYANVKEDIKIKAEFKPNTYTIQFVDEDGTVLKTEKVLYGESTTPPEDPTPKKEGYVFGGWDSAKYQNVSGNATINASYVWGNVNLPVLIKSTSCTFLDDVYTVNVNLENYPNAKTVGRAIVSLKTAAGKLLVTTESNVFVLGQGATKSLEICVPYSGAASQAEVVIIDSFSKKIPLSKNKTVAVSNDWSSWTTTKPTGNVTTESRTEYRTNKKVFTKSSSSSLSGWTKQNTTWAWSNWGNWSGWSTTAYSASDNRQVETKQEAYTVQTGTLFNYSHWVYYSGGTKYYTWSQSYAQARGGWYEERGWGNELYLGTLYDGTAWGGWSGGQLWFNERTTPKTETRYRTLYRYRTRSKVYTYHYWKWNGWSSWSTTKATATSDLQVQTRTSYRWKAKMAEFEDKSGQTRTVSGKVATDLAGQQATLFVYKYDEASDYTNEYVGQTTIGSDGSYSFTFVTKEEPTAETGDFTIDLAIEGATEPIYIGTIEAPKPVYMVTFVDHEGNVIGEPQTIEEGGNTVPPEVPEREGYVFTGWNTGVTNIHDDLEIVAEYEKEKYIVMFVDWEKQEVDYQEYEAGSEIAPPAESTREGYTFKNWLDEDGNVVTTVDKDLVLTAEYEINKYTVIFYDRDKNVLSEQIVEYGQSALVPEVEEIENMVFTGWGTNDYINVKRDIEAYATYAFIYTSEMPVADKDSGKYAEEFAVTLTAAEGAKIYYTTDGSMPDSNEENTSSLVYSEPITISSNTVLRYMTVEEDKNVSDVGTRVYLITANEDMDGALIIKNDILNLKVEDEEAVKLSCYCTDATKTINYYSVDENVATVDAEGNVKGLHVGTTTIFAVTSDLKYASSCTVNVITDVVEVESMELNTTTTELTRGESLALEAAIYPQTATYQDVIWISSNSEVATVDTEGNVTATGEGITSITAYSYSGNCYIDCTVEVNQSEFKVSTENVAIEVGQTYQIQALESTLDVSEEVTWTSCRTDIATVENGLVTAVAPGVSLIVCMNEDGEYKSIAVTVYAKGELPVVEPGQKGDVNGDETVDAGDALAVLKSIAGMTVDNYNEELADCNGDGTVDAGDALLILKFVAGMIATM